MKLSIIVTAYNIESYIAQCLDSIIAQTIKDIEIIVVDDGSSDATPKIIEEYAVKDPRIIPVLMAENTIGGVATAANIGLDKAQGEYIGFADGDDWYELDMFEKLYQSAASADADVSFCNYLEYDESDQQKEKPSDARRFTELFVSFGGKLPIDTVDYKRKLLRLNPVPWRKIYRRSLLDEHQIRFPVGDYFFEDNPFHWEVVITANSFVFDDFIGCYHRVKRAGQTMASADKRLLAMYEHHKSIRELLVKYNKVETYQPQAIAWLMGNTSWISEKIDPEFHHDLMQALKLELDFYDEAFLNAVKYSELVGVRMTKLMEAALSNDFSAFEKYAKENSHISKSYIDKSNIGGLLKVVHATYKEHGLKVTCGRIVEFSKRKLNINKQIVPTTVTNKQLLEEIKTLRKDVIRLQGHVRVLKGIAALEKQEKK